MVRTGRAEARTAIAQQGLVTEMLTAVLHGVGASFTLLGLAVPEKPAVRAAGKGKQRWCCSAAGFASVMRAAVSDTGA